MALVVVLLILFVMFLPKLVADAIERAFGLDRRRLRAARAWGLGLRRSGPWFWRVGGH